MTNLAYRMEILAEDVNEAPGALWKRDNIEAFRLLPTDMPVLIRIVVAVDPTGTTTGDEAGIIVAGTGIVPGMKPTNHLYVLEDASQHGSPLEWAQAAVNAYTRWGADRIVAETNYGGEMVETVLRQINANIPYTDVHASRGKTVRAEPVSALYEKGRGHHVGQFPKLEDECCLWLQGDKSPNRLDALVWAATELIPMGESNDDALLAAFGLA